MNTTISLPYGKGALTLNVPEENLKAVMAQQHRRIHRRKTQAELVEDAIAHPHGGLPLRERVRGKKKVVVISSDHTRPVPSRLLMPIILREIRTRKSGSRYFHPRGHRLPPRSDEAGAFGSLRRGHRRHERIVIHNADDNDSLVDLGLMASGNRLLLNRVAYEADFLMAEGLSSRISSPASPADARPFCRA